MPRLLIFSLVTATVFCANLHATPRAEANAKDGIESSAPIRSNQDPQPTTRPDAMVVEQIINQENEGEGEDSSPSRAYCVDPFPDPVGANDCYICETPIRPGCDPVIRCGSTSISGKSFCTITYGGGKIKCEVTGATCSGEKYWH